MSTTKTEQSNLDTLAEKMLKRQTENNVQACDLDANEECEACGS